MTLGLFSLADASISQTQQSDGGKKPPPKRTSTAVADSKLIPEPR
ncbi:MAG TPA: hypothetical protein VNJ05_07120 [Sphingomicrobium sp.]|nr:hypothetical protein [Sphingomicrobium sp.]